MDNVNKSLMELLMNQQQFSSKIGSSIEAKNIMVIAPHPDDEVVGCGGTILASLEKEIKVTIVYVTDGRYGVIDKEANIRRKEAEAAWAPYKNIQLIYLDYEDTHITTNLIDEFARLIESIQPEIIFTPWVLDNHVDHQITSIYLSKALANLKEHDIQILSYEVLYPLYANKTINITKFIDSKLNLIKAFKTQNKYLQLDEIIKIQGSLRGKHMRLKSIKSAESFFSCTVNDFVRFINIIVGKI